MKKKDENENYRFFKRKILDILTDEKRAKKFDFKEIQKTKIENKKEFK